MVKAVLGVSLDELGIGLINVGSVGFENIACIFDETRLQRNCAIITDYDATIEGASKSKPKAEALGKFRSEKLDKLFDSNSYVETFYAPHTLEVDFANLKNNRGFINEVIKTTYKDQPTIDKHIALIDSDDEVARYDSVMTVVNNVKKGWYATLLAAVVDYTAIIPDYIIKSLAFASHEIIDEQIIWKIVKYSFSGYDSNDTKDLKKQLKSANTEEKKNAFVVAFRNAFPKDMATMFLDEVDKYDQ